MPVPAQQNGAQPTSLESVYKTIREYSDNPSAFLSVNSGNSHFTADDVDGLVVYRPSGRYLVQFGGPVAPADSYHALVEKFGAFARAQRKRIVAVQLQDHDARHYAEFGYTVNQIGGSYAIDLPQFTMRGSRFMQMRNKISRAHRAGLTVLEVDQPTWHDAMRGLDEQWLGGKGKHAKPLEFLVGEYGGPMQHHRRLFIGLIDDQLVGYISYSPVHGSRPGWLHDLSRRLPDGPPGIMEAINKTAIEVFREEGAGWLHFGFTPFTALDQIHQVSTASGWFSWLVRQLGERGHAVYPAKTQLAYKQKWAPQLTLPEYVAFSRRASITGFLQVFKVANAL